jgi:hypothetical protein
MPSQEHESLKKALESRTSPSIAAQAFMERTKSEFLTGAEIETHLNRAWTALIETAASTPHVSQEPLVAVIQAVQQENLSGGRDGKECVIWDNDMKLWGDMPLFGPSMREAWNKRL